MAFRRKAHRLAIEPDIAIIQECECPERLKFGLLDPKLTDILCYGDNPNKGLGIFSYTDYRFQLHDWHNLIKRARCS